MDRAFAHVVGGAVHAKIGAPDWDDHRWKAAPANTRANDSSSRVRGSPVLSKINLSGRSRGSVQTLIYSCSGGEMSTSFLTTQTQITPIFIRFALL